MLTKKFFKDNPVKENTTQEFIYSSLLYDGLEEIASEYAKTFIQRGEDEAEAIKNETSPEVLLKRLRGNCDPLNYTLLREKILEQEETLLPIIIEKLKTSMNDIFIEQAIKLINKAKVNYNEKLVEMIDDIRSPYALSLVCMLIGILGSELDVKLLLQKHAELKSLYPEDDYEQGALLGLIELRERFKLLRR